MGSSPLTLDAVVLPLIRGPRILDVGCGFGRWGALLTTNYWETYLAEPSAKPSITGCDGHLPNVLLAEKSGFYTEVVHLRFPPLPFGSGSFDTVLLIEVIEHLSQQTGVSLIEEAKRIASHRVIISTPNWPAFRDGHATMTGWNELEAHLSYWQRRRLRALEFKLYGAGWHPAIGHLRGCLMRLHLLSFYDVSLRPSLASLSRSFPVLAENVVGVWKKHGQP